MKTMPRVTLVLMTVIIAIISLFAYSYSQAQSKKLLDLSSRDKAALTRIVRGAYLVEGLGHCGSCHTPRGAALQELGHNSFNELFLAGGTVDGWVASNLRTSTLNEENIFHLLKYGTSDRKGVAGPMKNTVLYSTQYLSDPDLKSIATYLVYIQEPVEVQLPVIPSTTTAQGEQLYRANCSSCHGEQGEGISKEAPMLVGNSTVIAQPPHNYALIITQGAETPETQFSSSYFMPSFQNTLSEEEIVQVINYTRQAWGNQAQPITYFQYKNLLRAGGRQTEK